MQPPLPVLEAGWTEVAGSSVSVSDSSTYVSTAVSGSTRRNQKETSQKQVNIKTLRAQTWGMHASIWYHYVTLANQIKWTSEHYMSPTDLHVQD